MERDLAVQTGRPDRDRGPPKGPPAGVEARGGYPGRSRDRDVARPARRRRCGKARIRPPDASFRKTVCAERSVFVETVFLSAHPGEGPGAPPRLPNFPAAMPGRAFACPVFENLVPRHQPPHPERMADRACLFARRIAATHVEVRPDRAADGRAGVQGHDQSLIAGPGPDQIAAVG